MVTNEAQQTRLADIFYLMFSWSQNQLTVQTWLRKQTRKRPSSHKNSRLHVGCPHTDGWRHCGFTLGCKQAAGYLELYAPHLGGMTEGEQGWIHAGLGDSCIMTIKRSKAKYRRVQTVDIWITSSQSSWSISLSASTRRYLHELWSVTEMDDIQRGCLRGRRAQISEDNDM